MRFGEIVALTLDDFDFKNNLINVNKTWGYNSRMAEGFGETKNKEARVVKVGSDTMQIIEKALNLTIKNEQNLFFYDPSQKYKVISNSMANVHLKKITKKLGIKEITVHSLRHTHASILLFKKVSIHYVSERLGHSDINTTYSYYSHVIKELRIEEDELTTKIFV